MTQAEMILTCTQEVAASNLGHDTNYLKGGFSLVGYLQSLHTNARTIPPEVMNASSHILSNPLFTHTTTVSDNDSIIK
jgi:hypothetical protein